MDVGCTGIQLTRTACCLLLVDINAISFIAIRTVADTCLPVECLFRRINAGFGRRWGETIVVVMICFGLELEIAEGIRRVHVHLHSPTPRHGRSHDENVMRIRVL